MNKLIICLLVISACITAQIFAEAECKICGGWGHASAYGRLFDPEKVKTVSGEVVSISKISPMDTEDYGLSFVLDTGNDDIYVHLGPCWFVESEGVTLEEGDRVEVTGSHIEVDREPVIVVTKIKKGNSTMLLRSPEGQPAWSGWKRGQ